MSAEARIAAVQYELKPIARFADFAAQVEGHVTEAVAAGAMLVMFPEFFTAQLLTIPDALGRSPRPLTALADFTQEYHALFRGLAMRHGRHILAGTHMVKRGNRLYNTAHLFAPDGSLTTQEKLHLTPSEPGPWGLTPGADLTLIRLPFAAAAILVCYDMEFPELARQARARGAELLLCPSCTYDIHGLWRVRHTAHARAVEDQVYAVVTGTVGGLDAVEEVSTNAGQAAFITPCDEGFPAGGLVAEGPLNQAATVTAALDFDRLRAHRDGGSVRTWQDRRGDLYPLAQ